MRCQEIATFLHTLIIQHVTYFKNIPLLPSKYFAADREGSKFLLECKVIWAHWYVG